MNELQIFNFEGKDIRTVIVNDQPWFVGKDVAEVLGYSNSRKALADHVDADDKGVTNRDTLGGNQDLVIINESGLYSLILKSQLPGAKKIKKWVTSEVLPSIRKHGAYLTEDVMVKTLNDPNYIIGLIQAIAASREEISAKNQIIGELKPKADYLDQILAGKQLVTTTQIAKDYGMSAVKLNALLHSYRIQFYQNNQWLLYSNYHAKGYTSSKFVQIQKSDGRIEVKMNTAWTQKGRMFLYDFLKKQGIIPTIERQ